MIPSLEGMEPVDYARYVAITVAFLVAGLSSEKVFLRVDVVSCIMMGVGWLCFPNVFLDFQVSGPRNQAHVLYSHGIGLVFLFAATPILLNKRTRDNKVFTSLYLCRFIGFAMMLISLFYSHWKFSKSEVRLTARQFWFTGLAVVGWMFGTFRHLLVSGDATNSQDRPAENQIKYHMLVDVLMSLLGSFYLMGYAPQTFLDLTIKVNADDGFLQFASFTIAAFTLSDCLFVLAAHSFDDSEVLKNIFKMRVLMMLATCILYLYHGLLQTNSLMIMFIVYGIIAFNSLLAMRFLSLQKVKEL